MSNSIAVHNPISPRRSVSLLILLGLSTALLVGLAGCRSTADNQIDLLERELRVQEDYIYELEGYVVDYSEKLRDCRSCSPSQTAVYSEEVYQAEPKKKESTKPAPSRSRSKKEKSILDKPDADLPSPQQEQQAPEFSPEDLEVPDELDLELEDPVTDNRRVDSSTQQVAAIELDHEPADGRVLMIPDPVDFNDAAELALNDTEEALSDEAYDDESYSDENYDDQMIEDQQLEATSATVDRIAQRLEITKLFVGEGDGESAQNLLTVVEALDENGEPVDLDGEVSLMVMSTDDSGQLKRIKRWNFTPEETISAWQSSDLGDGLHLELPLETAELPDGPIELWARLKSADGRKLLTQLPFEATGLGQLDDPAPQTEAAQAEFAEAEPSSVNPLRRKSRSSSADDKLTLASQSTSDKPTHGKPASDQPSSRWRSSMHRTDRTSEGFASTTSTATGWTKQLPGRLPTAPPKMAIRPSSTQPTQAVASKPTWTSGRSVLPVNSTGTDDRKSSNSWSTNRY